MEPTDAANPPFSTHTMELEPRPRHAEVSKVIAEANLLLAQPDPPVHIDFPELASIQQLRLDSNPTFTYLKSRLEEYFEELRSKTDRLHPDKSRKWKEALYSSLLKALLELTFTAERQLQERYLQRISRWYSEKTQTTLPDVRPRSRTMVQERHVPMERLNTVAVSQRARLSRMEIRRMDAIKTIEARSTSPVRTISPFTKPVNRPRAFQGQRLGPFNDVAIAAKLALLQARREKASSAHAHHKLLMKRWGSARSRLDEVLTQRREMRGLKARVESESEDEEEIASPTEPISTPSVPVVFNLVDKPQHEECIEKTRSLLKVERIRYAYRNLLPESQDRSESPSTRGNESLSLYSARLTADSPNIRTPSPIDLRRTPLPASSHQRAELQSLRKKLAKSNIACNYDILNGALNRPAELPQEHLSHLFLPSGGEYFTPNPFSSLGKKKKKKGKKKKKKE